MLIRLCELLILIISFSIYSQEKCIGWATVDGKITGGEGGDIVTVSNASDLKKEISKGGKRVIKIKGKIAETRISLSGRSDMTIEGDGPGAELETTFYIGECSNLIFRNLIISAVKGGQMDIFCIEEKSHHIWIDHCDISDKRPKLDGLVDMTHGCDNITISWNKFHYPDSSIAHRFAMLICHSDDAGNEDRNKERITIHHNWWAENIEERMPRARFGKIHVFNNYYNSVGNNYCIGPGVEAMVVVESNYFENVKDPHIFYNEEKSAQIRINSDNYYTDNVSGKKDVGQGNAFEIPYQYKLDHGSDVKRIVTSGAGPFGKPVKVADWNNSSFSKVNYHASQKLESKTFTMLGDLIPNRITNIAIPVIIANDKSKLVIPIKK